MTVTLAGIAVGAAWLVLRFLEKKLIDRAGGVRTSKEDVEPT